MMIHVRQSLIPNLYFKSRLSAHHELKTQNFDDVLDTEEKYNKFMADNGFGPPMPHESDHFLVAPGETIIIGPIEITVEPDVPIVPEPTEPCP